MWFLFMQVCHRPGGDGLRSEQEEDDPARCLQGACQGQYSRNQGIQSRVFRTVGKISKRPFKSFSSDNMDPGSGFIQSLWFLTMFI